MWHHGNHWGTPAPSSPMMMGGGIITLILVIILILLVLYAIRKLFSLEKHYKKDDAVTILRERYAKGELSHEEYRERLNELEATANKSGTS